MQERIQSICMHASVPNPLHIFACITSQDHNCISSVQLCEPTSACMNENNQWMFNRFTKNYSCTPNKPQIPIQFDSQCTQYFSSIHGALAYAVESK